jgi:hypothetical protein
MGNCASAGATEVSDEDKRRHREAEKSLKEVRVKTATLSAPYMRICGVSSLSVHSTNKNMLLGEAKDVLTGQGRYS